MVFDPQLAFQVVNPMMHVRITNQIPLVDDIVLTDVAMDFDIDKDQEEEPNEATLTIYNLSPSTRSMLSNGLNQNAPIEISATPGGFRQLAGLFLGRIVNCRHIPTRPGHETILTCEDSEHAHTAKTFSGAFPAGTQRAAIIKVLAAAMGMRVSMPTEPVGGIINSTTFDGPAFGLLCKFVGDFGWKAYITDGVLYVRHPAVPAIIPSATILDHELLGVPQIAKRSDNEAVERAIKVENFDPVAYAMATTAQQKRKIRMEKGDQKTVVTDYAAVDTTVTAVDFECMLRPDILPDGIITIVSKEDLALIGKTWRVNSVNHYGNNYDFEDWTTHIEADAYL